MSLANASLLQNLGYYSFVLDDDQSGKGNATQTGATGIAGEALRCVVASASNNSFILKSVLSGDAAPLTFVINDSAVTINAYPAIGEFNNGVANQGLAVPAGQSGIFVRVPNNQAGSSSGWRSAVIP